MLVLVLVLVLGVGRANAAPPAVSADQAKKIALARVPGTVMHEKLKKGENKGKQDKKVVAHDHYYVKIAPKDSPKKWKRGGDRHRARGQRGQAQDLRVSRPAERATSREAS